MMRKQTNSNSVFFRPEEINRLLPELKSLGAVPEDFFLNSDNLQEAADYINGFLRNKLVPDLNPTTVYDYQALYSHSACPTCERPLLWQLSPHLTSDKFMIAQCCGLRHEMVPEQVRVITLPMGAENKTADEVSMADKDFLEELKNLQ